MDFSTTFQSNVPGFPGSRIHVFYYFSVWERREKFIMVFIYFIMVYFCTYLCLFGNWTFQRSDLMFLSYILAGLTYTLEPESADKSYIENKPAAHAQFLQSCTITVAYLN